MKKISNRAIISRLFSSANLQIENASFDIESWSQWYNVVQDLTGPEKMVYLIVKLNQTVTNGGFNEFYEMSFGIFAPEVVHVLNEINAVATAEIVSSTLPIVNPEGLLDEAYKELVFNIQLSEQQKIQLQTEDMKYDHLQDHENLEDLMGEYLQQIIQ